MIQWQAMVADVGPGVGELHIELRLHGRKLRRVRMGVQRVAGGRLLSMTSLRVGRAQGAAAVAALREALGEAVWVTRDAAKVLGEAPWEGAREGPQRGAPPPNGLDTAYRTLGVSPGAPLDEVKAAYRAQSRAHHPDHGGDPERMKAINAAWEAIQRAGNLPS